MSYPTVEVSEFSAKQTYLYFIQGVSFELYLTNAQKTIEAEISGVTYSFVHPLGGITHTEPAESQDAGRTSTTLIVSLANTLYRRHKEYPPHGNTTLVIYRQNEIGGDPYQIWSGTIFSPTIEVGDKELEVHFECLTDFELMARAEGLNDTFQNPCNWFNGEHPCPVNRANWKTVVTVVSIDTENLTVTVSGASDKIADWFTAGFFEAPNGDKRTILDDVVSGANHVLTLQQNFPSTSLRASDSADAYAGDDRAYTTCRDKFGSETGNGAAFGGNPIQTNISIHEIGRLQ
jgi:hypothetical protein